MPPKRTEVLVDTRSSGLKIQTTLACRSLGWLFIDNQQRKLARQEGDALIEFSSSKVAEDGW
jgi:hypothetical protein